MSQSKVLLQTTIPATEDDWSIARFSSLRSYMESIRDAEGRPCFEVVARDRGVRGKPDPVLSDLDQSDFSAVWLFGVDAGDGLTAADCSGLARFRRRGGGLLVTRDHMDLGASVQSVEGVGAAHHFHTRNLDPDQSRHVVDDAETAHILWPNYHSGRNGDFQEIEPAGALHPLLTDPTLPGDRVRYLPAHPHEGSVGAPANDPTARVIATGVSRVTGRRFNIAVAFEASAQGGRAIAQSTFHHFADYNWNPACGCPSFVDEPPGDSFPRSPAAQASVKRYVRNAALWLSGLPIT